MNAFLWAVVTACIWGVVPLIEKVGLAQNDPVIGLFARSCGVVLGMAVFGLAWSPWQALSQMPPASMALLALGGFLASFIGQLAFYQALKQGQLTQIVPVAGTYPLVAAVLGWLFLRESLTLSRVIGVALVVSGMWFLRR